MIKAIVTDMDGTLLAPGDVILPETKKKLLELQDKGVSLILASGRSYSRLLDYAKELEMDRHKGYLIEVDGVAVYKTDTKERKVLKRMQPEEIRDVYQDLMDAGVEPQACFDDGFFYYFNDDLRKKKEKLRKELNLPDDYPWTAGPWNWLTDSRKGYPHQTFITDPKQIDRPINKIQLMDDEDKIPPLYEKLMKKYGDRFEIFRTCPRQLEILPKGYSKGATLKRIMDANGWKPEEVVAFGDGENDVSLFDAAANSYAMANAADFVKEKAKKTTASNADNGIVKALEDFGL